MSREAAQVEAVERLLQRQRDMSSFGYGDGFITVSVAEVAGALAEGAADWDAQQVGVVPSNDSHKPNGTDWKEYASTMLQYRDGKLTARAVLEKAGFDEEFIKAFIRGNAVCPECHAGKHDNCDGTALSDDDEIVDCRCARQGHGE